ncbi:unnamed protein product [Prorocentrum cordatum]|uniref:Uncharacterized protein n=1 Tax=Prorocentrum cordatum TaxID=2364126 RepID=A0ABN9SKA2_9DINO|nr:unnamed protein product [Polarella glacialis]CAK0832193.1 unnamed protein product [Polarella glacialis]
MSESGSGDLDEISRNVLAARTAGAQRAAKSRASRFEEMERAVSFRDLPELSRLEPLMLSGRYMGAADQDALARLVAEVRLDHSLPVELTKCIDFGDASKKEG